MLILFLAFLFFPEILALVAERRFAVTTIKLVPSHANPRATGMRPPGRLLPAWHDLKPRFTPLV